METDLALSHDEVQREIIWSSIGSPSLEYCCLSKRAEGWRFSGTLVGKLQGISFGVRYELLVEETFKTRSLRIEKMGAGKEGTTKVEFRDGKWIVNGKDRVDLRECTDIDIEASPVTNTIPIRRYRLKVGERVDLTVAWVRFPNLLVTPLKQSYQRVGDREYQYRSESGFTALIQVDDLGLVTSYGNIWKEVA